MTKDLNNDVHQHRSDFRSAHHQAKAFELEGAAPLDHPNSQRLLSSGLKPEQVGSTGCFNYKGGLAFTYLDANGSEYACSNGEPFFRYRPNWSNREKAEASARLENPAKYLSPKNSGCTKPFHSPLHIQNPGYQLRLKKTKYPLILTEGEIKTLVSSIHEIATGSNTVTIGLGGVSAFSDKRTELDEDGNRQLIPELRDEIEWEHRDVYIAFDSDLIEKRSVRSEVEALAIALHKVGAQPWLIRLPQELPGSYQDPKNGLDDFIIRHDYEAFLALMKSALRLEVSYINLDKGKKQFFLKGFQAEPSGKSESHIKALMAWSALKESCAVREGVGFYEWNKTHWQLRGGKTLDALALKLESFFDAQQWVNRGGTVFNTSNAEFARRLTVAPHQWAPSHLLSFSNTVLDTNTRRTQPHSPTARITSCLPYAYDTKAQCPKWMQFLEEALGGDQSLVLLARAATRWILMPKEKDVPFEIDKAFNCNGPRGSGKGTFVSTISALVGSANVGAGGPDVYGDKEKLAQLVDKKLALDSDAKGFLPSSTDFNKVVSNEQVTIEAKYKDSDYVALGVVVLWASNERISVATDGAEGVGRRLISIPFNNRPENVNVELKGELREELAGIFQWAWSLPEEEMFKVLSGPVESALAIELAIEQLLNSNLTLRYLSEKLPDGCDWKKASDIYESFAKWIKNNGHTTISSTTFGKELNRIKGAESKRSNGIKWRLPAMKRWNGMEHSTVANDSKRKAFYDYAEHLGIGTQSAKSETTPNGSKRESSGDGEEQPFQQPFQPKTQSLTEESLSKKSNGIVGRVFSREFCKEEGIGDTPSNRGHNGINPSNPSNSSDPGCFNQDQKHLQELELPSMPLMDLEAATTYTLINAASDGLHDVGEVPNENNIFEVLLRWKKAPSISLQQIKDIIQRNPDVLKNTLDIKC